MSCVFEFEKKRDLSAVVPSRIVALANFYHICICVASIVFGRCALIARYSQ